MYSIYFLEENDNARVLFDKQNLVHELIGLYNEIGVTNLNLVDANEKVSQDEKDMIVNTLVTHTVGSGPNGRGVVLDIVYHTKKIWSLKQSLSPQVTSKLQPPAPFLTLETTSSSRAEKTALRPYYKDAPTTPMPVDYSSGYENIMESWWKEKKESPLKKSICVLYNQTYECGLIRPYTKTIKDITQEFGDFEIVKEYTDIPSKSVDILNELIGDNMYSDKASFQKKLDAFESLYDVKGINQNEEEKSQILFYIQQNFIISDDVSKRIKVSTLLEEVTKDLCINNPNLKYTFANNLSVLGLQKKRFTDGMYLYGIESKASAKVKECLKAKSVTTKEYESLIDTRLKEIDSIWRDRTGKHEIIL